MNEAPARPLRSFVPPLLFGLVAFASFIALGTWQLERKAWKEALIDTLQQRLAAAPTALPPRAQWATLDAAHDEFRRVKFTATFVPSSEAMVYASGSALRADVSGPGYWIFAPARDAEGALVVINRGFVPDGRQDPATRKDGEIAGPVELVGAMRWPEPRGMFAPADDPGRNLWFVRDHLAMAAAKGWGAVAPFFVELESPLPPGGLPHPDVLKVNLRNEHLQYAITWYALAVVTVVMVAFWLRSQNGGRRLS